MDLELACLVWVYSWHPEADEDEDQDEAGGSKVKTKLFSHEFSHTLPHPTPFELVFGLVVEGYIMTFCSLISLILFKRCFKPS
jgi:hypothetical protein